MPGVSRLGDLCTGHSCYPSRPSITGSPDVFVNDKPVHRVSDLWDVHVCKTAHDGVTISGSSDIFVNDKPIARIGDQINCGSSILQGSDNVLAND